MKIYVDGNPGEVCCVADGKIDRAKIDKYFARNLLTENTNNVAEYRAVLFGLYKHPEANEVCSDSTLVVKQLNGEYAVRKPHLLPWWERVIKKVATLGHEVKFTWVSRDENPAGKILG